jgi:flagellar secretion chaperone FliS
MNLYQQRALEGASGVELTVALYDGMIRFLREAIAAVEREDVIGRRIAIKRAMDILIHLQGTLRMDIGGKPAEALSEFYAAMFALMLQGSVGASRQKFDQAIACIQNVRDAWRKVALENVPLPAGAGQSSNEFSQQRVGISEPEHEMASSWTA